jgi:chromosome segregation ATPase
MSYDQFHKDQIERIEKENFSLKNQLGAISHELVSSRQENTFLKSRVEQRTMELKETLKQGNEEITSLKSQLEQAQASLRKAKQDLHYIYCEDEDEDSPAWDYDQFKKLFPNLYEHQFKHIEEALK